MNISPQVLKFQIIVLWGGVIAIVKAVKVNNTGELTFIGEISTKFLCVFPLGSLTQLLNHICPLFYSSNMYFKIADRLFEDRGEIVQIVRRPQICFTSS
jgi:hypothetical protein